jgi:hypothetical protein
MKSTTLLLGALVALLAAAGSVQAQPATTPGLELIGQIVLPTGLKIDGVEFGGISGLSADPVDGSYLAISDDRSERGPARYYRLKLDLDADGLHGVDIAASHILRGLDGNAFPLKGIDPEAIQYVAAKRSFFWSSETDVSGHPGIYEAQLDGTMLRSLTLPEYFLTNADGTNGTYSNLGLEGLTLSVDGTVLYAITENGLVQDGAKATLEAGSPSRIISFDAVSGKAGAEYVYVT